MTTNAWLYILRCADGSLYVGSTVDLEARLWQHQEGQGAAYTRRRGRRPVELVYAEPFESVFMAFCREKQIQGWSRAKRLAYIEQRYDELPELAERYATKRRRAAREEELSTTLVEPPER